VEDSNRLFLEINGPWSCNFNCPYCSVKTNVQPDKVALEKGINYDYFKDIIDDFFSAHRYGKVYVQGGEPFFYFDKFSSFVSTLKKEYPQAPIHITTNCSMFTDEERLNKVMELGLHSIGCSLNSHIPEVHNKTRGLPGNSTNSQFILSLPKRTGGKVNLGISAVPFDENIDHFKDFIKHTFDAGFYCFAICFTEISDKGKLIKLYSWIHGLSGALRKYIFVSDLFLEELVRLQITKNISPSLKCLAPTNSTFVSYTREISPCASVRKCSRPYRKNDISNPDSEYNVLRRFLYDYCHYPCMINPCYFA
jgi:MoaA/NifB/PqqE/SkfB family radical SAM enzyme